VILKPRFPPDQNWSYSASPPHALNAVPNAFVAVSQHKLSQPGAQFLFILEAGWPGSAERKKALHPYWPGGQSGVTIGAGYDMSAVGRTAQVITADLTRAGADAQLAAAVGKAFALVKGSAAQEQVSIQSKLAEAPILTDRTAWNLMLQIIGPYERGTMLQLPIDLRDRLFVHEFDALVAETYQWWSLYRKTLNMMAMKPIHEGDLSKVKFMGPPPARSQAEDAVFHECCYNSAVLHQ
jgi:hypothetical protein